MSDTKVKHMWVDGHRVEFTDEKNVLDVVRKAGIELPTFCYYTELSVYGACRMCVVENEWGGVEASCSMPPKDGMKIRTNTPKLQKHRKMILELLLSSHCRDCTTCSKNGRCRLQSLARRFGITTVRFDGGDIVKRPYEVDESSLAIIRDPNKCILCGDCVRMCSEIQHVGAIDFKGRGSNMTVSTAFDEPIATTRCVGCGQCAAVCSTGAITVRDDRMKVWNEIYDPKKRVVVQVAPAVRVALGEEFGIKSGENVMGKIVAGLRMLGFDEIYDTSLGADLTVMEESAEFLKKHNAPKTDNDDIRMPLFTSCCPAWVRYIETRYPQYVGCLSSCKSPMQMFASVLKEHAMSVKAVDSRDMVSVAVMPCTAKKCEAAREEFRHGDKPDVDYVITTQELCRMLRESGIVFDELEPEAPDMPFGMFSGAGVIFGVTGGVTEAVIRRVAEDKSRSALNDIAYTGIRGMEGSKEAEISVDGETIRIAVVNGLENADALMQRLISGEAHYDFVEVMACPGGCVGGAGQPFAKQTGRDSRSEGLYNADRMSQIKRSEENPTMMSLYSGLLKNKTKELLHVHYDKKN